MLEKDVISLSLGPEKIRSSPVSFAKPMNASVLVLFWMLPALVSTLMIQAQGEDGRALPFGRTILLQSMVWLPWLLVTPLAFVLGARFQFAPGRRLLALVVHLAAAVGCSVGFQFYLLLSETLIFGSAPLTLDLVQKLVTHRPGTLLSTAPIYLLIWAAGRGIAFYRRTKESETLLARARLKALEARLQPHFLFNTLHAVVTLMEEDVVSARRMVLCLSELLRANLSAEEKLEVTLAEELALLEKYLEIEQIRFSDRLRVIYQIDSAARSAVVPQLLLQPLVENAIHHGISKRSNAGSLVVKAERCDTQLILTIEDDGPGLSETPIPEGLGLSITRQRLRARHGRQAKLVLEPRSPHGCRARVTLPYQSDPAP